MHVRVAVQPGDNAGVGEQHLAQLGRQDAAAGTGRPGVVDERLERMMAQQRHRPVRARCQLGFEPVQLHLVE